MAKIRELQLRVNMIDADTHASPQDKTAIEDDQHESRR